MTTPTVELHILLDDGHPHCSCGYSNRGKPYWEWEKHAFEALRTEVKRLTTRTFILEEAVEDRAVVIGAAQGVTGDAIITSRDLATARGLLRRWRGMPWTNPKSDVIIDTDKFLERKMPAGRGIDYRDEAWGICLTHHYKSDGHKQEPHPKSPWCVEWTQDKPARDPDDTAHDPWVGNHCRWCGVHVMDGHVGTECPYAHGYTAGRQDTANMLTSETAGLVREREEYRDHRLACEGLLRAWRNTVLDSNDRVLLEATWAFTLVIDTDKLLDDGPDRREAEADTVAGLVEEITEGSLVMGTCSRHVDKMMDDEPLIHPETEFCVTWVPETLAPSACARCSSPTPNPACPDCCPENDKHTAAQVSILDLLPILGTCDSSHNMRHDGVQALHGQVPGCRRWKEGVPPIPTPVLGTCEPVPEGGPEVLHNFICWNPHIEGPRCVGFQPLPTATTPESPASGVAEWIGEMPAKSVDTEALMPLPHPIDYLGVCEHEGHAHKGRHMLRFSCENWHATAEPDPKAFLNYDPKKGEVAPLGKCLTGHYVSPDGVQARHYAEVTCLQWRLAEPEALLGTCELFGRPHVERDDCKGWNTNAPLGFCDRHHEADGTHEEYLHAWSSVCDGWHLPFMGTLE